MAGQPIDLARSRVLISNDDGILAPGIRLLERLIRPLAAEVWVVAPEVEQSAASHSLTMRRPLFIHRFGRRRYAVDGTPTDSVLLAVHQVMKGRPPNLVLSGINRGGNLGEDATYSGTVAAAMEGTLLGIPSVAFSQVYADSDEVSWSTAEAWIGPVLERLLAATWPPGVLINVNFPNVPASQVTGVEVTRQGRRKIGNSIMEGNDPRGRPYYWIGGEREEDRSRAGTDLEAVHRGAISVTPLSLDLTDDGTVGALTAVFR
jgi:5'-nucleotidase